MRRVRVRVRRQSARDSLSFTDRLHRFIRRFFFFIREIESSLRCYSRTCEHVRQHHIREPRAATRRRGHWRRPRVEIDNGGGEREEWGELVASWWGGADAGCVRARVRTSYVLLSVSVGPARWLVALFTCKSTLAFRSDYKRVYVSTCAYLNKTHRNVHFSRSLRRARENRAVARESTDDRG